MIQLPNGCRCSELKVNPANWNKSKASIKKHWFIHYRFYDPQQAVRYPKGKLRIIKGMNEFHTVVERQEAVKALIETELNELKSLGFNPITERHELPASSALLITPETPFIEALHKALDVGGYVGRTRSDLKGVISHINTAATQLRINYLPVVSIKPSHLLLLLEQCGKNKKIWTNNTYNAYIRYVSILFSQILQFRAVEYNPARDLNKRRVIKKLRSILSPEECQRIDAYTRAFDERLWRFIHIFFHSGSRTTEILRVRGEHVDLKKQQVTYLVLKGRYHQWVTRTIKDIALPLWIKALEGCSAKDYVFSVGLKPGPRNIREEQISRRWRKHIKNKLGITCDFYSLKHLNTDQTSALLGLNAAAAHNSHKSTAITRVYAVNEDARMHELLKTVNNGFVPGSAL